MVIAADSFIKDKQDAAPGIRKAVAYAKEHGITTIEFEAGAGQLLRCGHVEISGCTYENMMNAGVLIGAELDTHCEAGHGNHINIHDCSFIRCGTKPRYGIFGMGGVAVKSQGFHGPYNHHIEITDNHFEECQKAVELYDCRDVIVKHNTFTDCNIEVYRDFKTTESVEECRRKQE